LRIASGRVTAVSLLSVGLAALVLAAGTTAGRSEGSACSPRATILESPRPSSQEVQVKALNDRGDVVGFADSENGSGAIHAILWKGGSAADTVDLGVLPGYVSSEAYGVNDQRVVFGLLYDAQDRTFPFRWRDGRMTVLRGPSGRRQQASGNPGSGGRNAINDRGEMTWTLMVAGSPRAVRWAPNGKASLLPRLPGHAWSWAFGINDDGIVSGWSRKLPSEDGEENPVIWTRAGKIVALQTVPGRADGIAEATNRSGLTVGYLGNQSDTEPESDQFAVWQTRTAAPRLMGPVRANLIAEFIDVNDRGQAVGLTGALNPNTGFTLAQPMIWRTGWAGPRSLRVPAASRRANPVLVTSLNDLNNRGAIVGNVYGLTGKDYSKLRRIDPVLWTCAFGA
jgi:probable HAF family extracellular repeat protein